MSLKTKFVNKNVLVSEIAEYFYETDGNTALFVEDNGQNYLKTIGKITHRNILQAINANKDLINCTVESIMSTNDIVNLDGHITLEKIFQANDKPSVITIIEDNIIIGHILMVDYSQELINEDSSIQEAVRTYFNQGCAGSLLVTDKNGKEIIGKVMFKHLIKAYFNRNFNLADSCVSNIMSRLVVDVKTARGLKEVINEMKNSSDIHHGVMDVISNNKLIAYIMLENA